MRLLLQSSGDLAGNPPAAATTVLLRDRVHERLTEEIMSCKREPGSRFSEHEIVVALGTSRGPVREALVRLAHEGLVFTFPQRGSFVSPIDIAKVEEAVFVRKHIETALVAALTPSARQVQELKNLIALQEIAMRENDPTGFFALDTRFHRYLYEIAGKIRIWELVQGFCVHLNRYRLLRLKAIPQWQDIVGQHRSLAEALESGDGAAAAHSMGEHIGQFEQDRLIVTEKYGDYFRFVR